MIVSLRYTLSNDSIQLRYEYPTDQDGDFFSVLFNCADSSNSYMSINQTIMHTSNLEDVYYHNVTGLSPSTDYTCCIISYLNVTTISCFNFTTKQNTLNKSEKIRYKWNLSIAC